MAMTTWPRRPMAENRSATTAGDRTLLIVEDDKSFLQRLARAMEGRGFTVTTAESVAEGLIQLETSSPAFAVVDMRLGDGNGLDVISALKRRRPDARAIILTGYGNIATAVTAVKLGALDYLAKPVDADDVVNALLGARRQVGRAAGKSDVGRSRALGAHPAHLRIVQPQRLGDRAPAQHAPPHAAAHPGEAGAEVTDGAGRTADVRARLIACPNCPIAIVRIPSHAARTYRLGDDGARDQRRRARVVGALRRCHLHRGVRRPLPGQRHVVFAAHPAHAARPAGRAGRGLSRSAGASQTSGTTYDTFIDRLLESHRRRQSRPRIRPWAAAVQPRRRPWRQSVVLRLLRIVRHTNPDRWAERRRLDHASRRSAAARPSPRARADRHRLSRKVAGGTRADRDRDVGQSRPHRRSSTRSSTQFWRHDPAHPERSRVIRTDASTKIWTDIKASNRRYAALLASHRQLGIVRDRRPAIRRSSR